MRTGHTITAALYGAIVAAIGFVEANSGWPLSTYLIGHIEIDVMASLPYRWAHYATMLPILVYYVIGAKMIWAAVKDRRYLHAAILAGMFTIVTLLADEFIGAGRFAGIMALTTPSVDVNSPQVWFLVGFVVSLPTAIRGAALDFVRTMSMAR